MTASDIEDLIARLRNDGWCVAVHNDYRLHGSRMTFWLWTHPNGTWIKGEGLTDRDALEQALQAADALAKQSSDISSLRAENEELRKRLKRFEDREQLNADASGYVKGHP